MAVPEDRHLACLALSFASWLKTELAPQGIGPVLKYEAVHVMPLGHQDRSSRAHVALNLGGKILAFPGVISVRQDEDRVIAAEASSPPLLPGFHPGDSYGRDAGLIGGDGVHLALTDGDEWRIDVQSRSVEHPPADAGRPLILVVVDALAVFVTDAPEGSAGYSGASPIRDDEPSRILLMTRIGACDYADLKGSSAVLGQAPFPEIGYRAFVTWQSRRVVRRC